MKVSLSPDIIPSGWLGSKHKLPTCSYNYKTSVVCLKCVCFGFTPMRKGLWDRISIFRSKTHKRLKERFLIGRNRTKRAHFRGSPLFQATYSIKKLFKKTSNSTYLVSVGWSETGGISHASVFFSKPENSVWHRYCLNGALWELYHSNSNKVKLSEFDKHFK